MSSINRKVKNAPITKIRDFVRSEIEFNIFLINTVFTSFNLNFLIDPADQSI